MTETGRRITLCKFEPRRQLYIYRLGTDRGAWLHANGMLSIDMDLNWYNHSRRSVYSSRCVNCAQRKKDHLESKCLFGPTRYLQGTGDRYNAERVELIPVTPFYMEKIDDAIERMYAYYTLTEG